MDSAILQRIHDALYAAYGAGAVLPFTQLSPWLKGLGVDYKTLGFEKLRDFVQTWSDFATIELRTPRPGNPPVAYLALRAAVRAEQGTADDAPQGLPTDAPTAPTPSGTTALAGPADPAKPAVRAPAADDAAWMGDVCPDAHSPDPQPHLATKEGNARRRAAAIGAFQGAPEGPSESRRLLEPEGPPHGPIVLSPADPSPAEPPSPLSVAPCPPPATPASPAHPVAAAAPAPSHPVPDGNLLDTLRSALLAGYGPGQPVPFATLGSWLRRQGVDYKALGYNKLREFVQSWSPFAVIHDHYPRPDSPPVAYLLIRNADGSLPAFPQVGAEGAQPAAQAASAPVTDCLASDAPTSQATAAGNFASDAPATAAGRPASDTPATAAGRHASDAPANVAGRPASDTPASPAAAAGDPGFACAMASAEDPAAQPPSRPLPDTRLLDTLRQALYANHSPGEEIPFTSLSPWLQEQGVDYKRLGYRKLRDFVQTWSNFADILTRTPHEGRPPVAYLVLKGAGDPAALAPEPAQGGSDAQATPAASVQGAPHRSQEAATLRRLVIRPGQKNNILPGRELEAWAYMGYWPETLRVLADLALPEKWSFGSEAEDSRPILRSYLCNTFFRLKMEDKILYSADGKWAAWNTGLVSGSYDEIFAVFGHNASPLSEWALGGFCIAGGRGLGKTLVANFSPLPSRASYFEHLQDLLYDVALPYYVDYRHIIVDNIRRLPVDFLKAQCYDQPACASSLAALEGNASIRNPAWEQLKGTVEETQMLYNRLRNRVQEAVELAIKRVSWNYKTAIPMFYPRFRSMSLMLPLCLGDDASIDAALVMDRTRAGNYQGQTILTLDQAYLDARLICRPDSEWLNPDAIDQALCEED